MKTIFSVVVSILLFFGFCDGRRMCYTCDTAKNVDCLYNPDNITETESQKPCKHYCTIQRKEFINIPGTIAIIYLKRDCEEKPFMKDGINAEGDFVTYYRSCKANLCNEGDGVSSLKHIPEEEDDDDDENETNGSYTFNKRDPNYYANSMRIFKIYFFVYVASIFSIT